MFLCRSGAAPLSARRRPLGCPPCGVGPGPGDAIAERIIDNCHHVFFSLPALTVACLGSVNLDGMDGGPFFCKLSHAGLPDPQLDLPPTPAAARPQLPAPARPSSHCADGTRISASSRPRLTLSACSGLRIHLALALQEHADRLALFSVQLPWLQFTCSLSADGVHGRCFPIRRCTFCSPHRQHHHQASLGPAQPIPTVRRAALSITNRRNFHRVKTCPVICLRGSSDCLQSQSRRRMQPLASARQSV